MIHTTVFYDTNAWCSMTSKRNMIIYYYRQTLTEVHDMVVPSEHTRTQVPLPTYFNSLTCQT